MQTIDKQQSNNSTEQLTFQFSKSKPQGSGAWLNGNRIAISFALSGTIARMIDADKNENVMRKAAGIVGLYANIMEMIFSDKISPIVGELALVHKDWKLKNGNMISTIEGKLPKQAEQEIERLVKDAALPNNAVTSEYDKEKNQTTIKITNDLFPVLQTHLKEELLLRQKAVNRLKDKSQMIKESNGHIKTSISLKDMNKKEITTLQDMLYFDFDVKSNIIYKENQIVLEIAEQDVYKINKIQNNNQNEHIDHLQIRSDTEKTYAPGFIETLFRPDLHPKQHGILVGALFGNLLTTAAGATEDKAAKGASSKKDPWESAVGIASTASYLIDFMPEVKKQNNRIFSSNDINLSPTSKKLSDLQEKLDERPLLTSVLFKIPMLGMKFKSGINAIDNGKGGYRLFAAAMNLCRTGITSTLQKGDYGRNT